MVVITIILALTIPITVFVMGFSMYKSSELFLSKYEMQPKTEEKNDFEQLSEIKMMKFQPKEEKEEESVPNREILTQDILDEWLNGAKDSKKE